MKICTRCKQEKELSEFYIDRSKKDGLYSSCKICVKLTKAQNIEVRRKYNKEHKREMAEYSKKYSETHKNEIKKYKKQYYEENKQQILEQQRKRYETDPMFRLNSCIRSNMNNHLKGQKAEISWKDIVNYTLEELKQHLENQFDSNMTWENYGEYWEIDHIKPVNLFNFTSPEDKEFKECWSLNNLRPLPWRENRKRPKDGSDLEQELIVDV